MHTTLLVLHVLAAVFIVGPMAVLPMTGLRALRAGSTDQAASLAKSTFVISLLSLLVVIFGFGVMSASNSTYHLSITTSWIWPSIVMYVIALALNILVVVPALREAAQADSGQATPGGGRYQRVAMSSGLSALLLAAIVVLMTWRP